MKKLITVLKIVVFSVGLITILLIVTGVSLNMMSVKPISSSPSGPETLYVAQFGSLELKVVTSEESGEGVAVMEISGGSGSSSIKLENPWRAITDSRIIPLDDGRYGVLVFYQTGDCDISSYDIDLFTYGVGINYIETITMTERYQLEDGADFFYTALPINAPYVEGFQPWGFTIPVSIRIGREIIITPLLTREGIALIQGVAAKDRQSIIAGLTEAGEEDDVQNYLNAEEELSKALAPRMIAF